MLDGEEYFTCACGSFDHTLRFVLDLDRSDDKDHIALPSIFTEMQMNHYLPWYKRVWLGIKFIFGTDVRHAYSCWEINNDSDDPERLIEMLQKLKNEIEKNKTKNI